MEKENFNKEFYDLTQKAALKEYYKLSKEDIIKTIKEGELVEKMWDNEIKSKEDIKKLSFKIQNKTINPYERVKSWIFIEYLMFKLGNNTNFFTSQNEYKLCNLKKHIEKNNIQLTPEFALHLEQCNNELGQMTNFFQNGKVFNISKELQQLLIKTKVDKEYTPCPYFQTLITLEDLVIENVEILGILIRDKEIEEGMNYNIIPHSKVNDLLIFCRDLNDGEIAWLYTTIFSKNIDEKKLFNHLKEEDFNSVKAKEWISDITFKKIEETIKNIVSNLLNLINHPEVEIINHSKSYLRENRIKKERLGIPDEIEINITGKLKRYISETISNNEKAWELGHRFWVRGHWMEFKDERYKSMKGKKKWILPYIKGKGEIINKDYYVGEKEQCWENQKRMIKIIQSIFIDKKIEKNNRTALDGLEIDCYIPELKLGFEYNGQQHYEWVDVFHKTEEEFKKQLERDIEKNKRALDKGIKLITIKYDEPLTLDHIRKSLAS